MRSRLKLAAILLFVVGGLYLTNLLPRAGAANANFSLTTSPLPLNLVVAPGHSTSETVRVQNSSTKPEHIKVSLMKFKAAGFDGRPILQKPGPADEFVKWVSFTPADLVAEPGEWNNVKLSVSPPASAGLGYYFAIVFSNADVPESQNNGPSNVLSGAVATMVLLDVHVPGEKLQMEVSSFTASKKLYEYLPASFDVALRNTGNIHGILSGSVFITSNGHKVAVLDVNPGGGNVLPNSTRIFSTTWDDGFPVFKDRLVNGQVVADKKGNNVKGLNWNFGKLNHFRFGRYTARFVGSYDNGSQDVPVGATVSFWVIPWKLLLIILLIVGVVLFGVFSGLRSGLRRRKK